MVTKMHSHLFLQLSNTAFCPEHVLEVDFLSRCVASHLMTFGRSLVVGETADRINLVTMVTIYVKSAVKIEIIKVQSLDFM